MIKRLKWNVLYAESAQDASDLSDSSAESVDRGTPTAQAVLDQLTTNDPGFAARSALQSDTSHTSSSDDEDTHQPTDSAQYDAAHQQHQLSNGSHEDDYVEWRECDLCPGKRFLNDAEVQAHLSSRRHSKALKRFEARSIRESNEEPTLSQPQVDVDMHSFARLNHSAENDTSPTSSSPGSTNKNEKPMSSSQEVYEKQQPDRADQQKPNEKPKMTEQEQRKADKRKASVKRRLRRLKEKKWEKRAQSNGVKETLTSQEEKRAPDKTNLENGSTGEEKREKARKARGCREVLKVQNSSSLGKNGGEDMDVEVNPSSPVRKPKERNKRKSKETLPGIESDGNSKRKKLRRRRAMTTSGDFDQDSRR